MTLKTRAVRMDRIHAYISGWDFQKLNPNNHLTDQCGLVSDFLSECWSRSPTGSRVPVLQGRVNYGGALSGRDITAVDRTVSGLLKLLYPDSEMPVPDEEVADTVRAALEVRRRVKEQQKRVFKSEFRYTHFCYAMGKDGIEKLVSTPELHSDEAIELDPLTAWTSVGHQPRRARNRAELVPPRGNCGQGQRCEGSRCSRASGVSGERPVCGAESVHARQELVGDREPRAHEFSLQLRALDNDRTGTSLGLPALMALCSGLLEKSTKGGLIGVSASNLGGSVEPLSNAVGNRRGGC